MVIMKKLIIFDLDGVLIDSRELHYESLNQALLQVGHQYVIGREENLSAYDGLNTTAKLELLAKNKGLSRDLFDNVWKNKQEITFELIKRFPKDTKLIDICQKLKQLNYSISVATNSIRETAKLALMSIGIMEYVDLWVTSQDVFREKPYPEIYWKCMSNVGALPKHTIVVEDSHIGRQGALNSGAHLCPVEDTWDVTWSKIYEKIKEVESL